MTTLASFEVQAQEEQQTPAPWLVIGLALGAALLLAAGMLVARCSAQGSFLEVAQILAREFSRAEGSCSNLCEAGYRLRSRSRVGA